MNSDILKKKVMFYSAKATLKMMKMTKGWRMFIDDSSKNWRE